MKKPLLKFMRVISRIDLLILILISWEIFAGYIYPRFEPRAAIFLPRFSSVVKELGLLLISGVLGEHVLASFKRVLIGFSLAAICGVTLGFAIGFSRRASEQLEGLCKLIRPIPPVAWIPLSLLWFGITDSQQYFIIFIGTVFPVLFSTLEGVQSVSAQHKQAARALGAGGWLLLKRVIFPAALPKIMFGLRSGIAFAWFIIVAAEFVSAPRGLGYLILEGRNVIITERIFVGMIAIGTLNLLLYYILTKIENRIAPWQKIGLEE